MTTRRWRFDLAYDGTDFSGWSAQPGRRTVQGELEAWLVRILRLSEPVALVCAGRTDAGVHARGQVAHLDLADAALAADLDLARRLRRVLPPDLVVRAVTPAPEGFDARFSALWRRYVYRLADDDTPPDPLLRHLVTPVRGVADVSRVRRLAPALLGLRDFAAFCRRREGATTVRTLLELRADRVGEGPMSGVVEVTVRADAFCHSMVRSLVGALMAVATGQREPEWLLAAAAGSRRETSVPVLPPGGLTLEEVGYPGPELMASRAREARSVRVSPS